MARLAGFAALAALVVVTGCSTSPTRQSLGSEGSHLTAAEQSLLAKRLQGAAQPRLSVAMSGGGIRSALFNFGVMKALYDDGILSQADIVSSVSGGSYLNYWLYTEQHAHPGTLFGYALFDESNFAHNLCMLTARSNFVTYPEMTKSIGERLWDSESLRKLYANGLQTTFGDADPGGTFKITDLKDDVESGSPYPIFNASTHGSMPHNEVWERRVFELTPLHYGNLGIRTPWEPEGGPQRTWELAKATLASGAALSILKRRFDDPMPGIRQTYLWDGGKTENLGAVAPLVRGTHDLIIVDAQFDDNEKSFSAVKKLKKHMRRLGTKVDLHERGEKSDPAVYVGLATTGETQSRLYYVKMMIPASLRETIDHELKQTSVLPQPYSQAVAQFEAVRGKYANDHWDCDGSKGAGLDLDKLMLASTAAYMSLAEGDGLYQRVWRIDPPWLGSLLTHQFPRTATPDQSFYLNEALAFVGLGYLNAKGKVKTLMEQTQTGR